MSKILICSADQEVAARWRRSVVELGRLSIATGETDLLSILEGDGPDIVLLDLAQFADYRPLPEKLCRTYPETAFIFLSPLPNEQEGLYLISNGARGYCNRYISEPLLSKAVEVVRMGEVWLGRKLLFKLMEDLGRINSSVSLNEAQSQSSNPQLKQLTEREQQIADLVGQGDSNKRIAQKLDITERTVKAHISAIFRKTGTRDRLQLGLLINVQKH